MKSNFKTLIKSVPLAIGIIFALLSVAYTVQIADGSGGEESVMAAIIFGLIGYPLIITTATSFIKDSNNN